MMLSEPLRDLQLVLGQVLFPLSKNGCCSLPLQNTLDRKQCQELYAVVCFVMVKWKMKDLWAAVKRELQCCLNVSCQWFCITIFSQCE